MQTIISIQWRFFTMKIVLLGPPGAGKGTIAAYIKDYYNIPHISTGDLFRSNIKNETELGKQIKELIAAGNLVPDSITIKLVENRISESDCKNGFILDGFPRTLPQADALSKMTDLDAVLNFTITDEEIIERLSGRRMCPSNGNIYHIKFNPPKVEGKDDVTGEPLIQRDDDKEESIKHRLEVYNKDTFHLIDYYTKNKMIINIESGNGQTPQQIFETVKSKLN